MEKKKKNSKLFVLILKINENVKTVVKQNKINACKLFAYALALKKTNQYY